MASPRPRLGLPPEWRGSALASRRLSGPVFRRRDQLCLLCLGLAFSCVALVAVGIGAVGLAWMVMEAPPSSVYHNLTASPPLALTDSRKNGYFMLLGFDALGEQDPLQAGYERKVEESDLRDCERLYGR